MVVAAIEEPATFEELVYQCYPSVYRFLRRLLGSAQDAEDAAQETFLAAWRALPRFRGEASLDTWLHAIAARKASDLMRRMARYRRQDAAAEERTASEAGFELSPDDPGDHERVLQALARLPERQRLVVTLVYFGEQSPAQVAMALEITESTVRCHLMHAHRSLRRWLSEEEAE